jgi:ABC-type transporter Mla subunit MlaD
MGRLPERDVRAASEKRGLFGWKPSNATIAVIFFAILIIGPYLAFTKHVPFTSYGYQLNATFANGVNIAKNSPVRIAGIEVGKVISTDREGDATDVTFTVDGNGRPIHEDASAAIRPRIFLEGNFYIDLDPGSPSSPELDSDGTIPVSHTSTAVQLDEVFSALQSPVRADLSRALQGFGMALAHEPTPAEDATQLPEVQGKSGAEGLNGALQYGGPASRYGAQVTDALTGTSRQDLSRLVASAGAAFGAFARRDADLEGLIVNFDTFTQALAAQSSNLSATFQRFAPALDITRTSLVNLNRTLPPLRAWAIELRPSVARLPGLIEASKPWLQQARPLLSGREGGGAAKLLREAVPGLAGAAQAGKAVALPQLNRLSLCETQVLQPTFNQTIQDRFSTGGPAYREFLYWLTALAGQTQNFDGNGHYLRIQPQTGDLLVRLPNPAAKNQVEKEVFGHATVAPQGLQPQMGGSPPKKPEARCDKNPVPDLNGPLGQPAAPAVSVVSE